MTFDARQALRYPLFADDFGEPHDRILSDAIVTARKTHACNECLSTIHVGDRYRKHVGLYGARVQNYMFCPACCAAMAAVFGDHPEAMEGRWLVRRKIEEAMKSA